MTQITRPQQIELWNPTYKWLNRLTLVSWFAGAVISVVAVLVWDNIGIVVSLVVMTGLVLRTMLLIYHYSHLESYQHYRQLEALTALHSLTKLRSPLPPLRLWAVSPDFALLVSSMIREYRPAHVFELGSGSSTLISSYTLEELGGGKVTSLEHLAAFAQASAQNVRKHGLDQIANVLHSPLSPRNLGGDTWQWYDLTVLPSIEKIDLLIVDGPPGRLGKLARYPAIPMLYEYLNAGAVILVDDVVREDETEMINRWLAEFDLEVIDVIANEKGAAILRKTAAPQ